MARNDLAQYNENGLPTGRPPGNENPTDETTRGTTLRSLTAVQEGQLQVIRDHLDNVNQSKAKLEEGLKNGNDAIKSDRRFYQLGGYWRPYRNDRYQNDVVTHYTDLTEELGKSITGLQQSLKANPNAANDDKVKALIAEVNQRVQDVIGSPAGTPGFKDQIHTLAVNGSNRSGASNYLVEPLDDDKVPGVSLVNKDGVLTLSGTVKDDATRTSILSSLKSAVGEDKLQGDVNVDPAAAEAGWVTNLNNAADTFKTPGVKVNFNGNAITVGGPDADRDKTIASLRSVFGSDYFVGAQRPYSLPQSISDWQKSPEYVSAPEEQRNVSIMTRGQVTAFNRMDDSTVRSFDRAFGSVAYEAARNNGATARNVSAEAKRIRRGLELAASGAYYDGYLDYAARNFGHDLVFGKGAKQGILSLAQDVHKGEKTLQQAANYLNANYHGRSNSIARNAFDYLSARENLVPFQQLNGGDSALLAQQLLTDQGLIVAGGRPGRSKIVGPVATTPLGGREDRDRILDHLQGLKGVETTKQQFYPPASGHLNRENPNPDRVQANGGMRA